MNWTPARDREKYGVAIYNFNGDNDACIKLNVGDTVHIFEELGEWYFGFALHNKAVRGVFPKSFIQVRECIVDKTGPVEVVSARLPPIVHEVTAVLREWGVLLRKLYVEEGSSGSRKRDGTEPKFHRVKDTMMDLISYRSTILSGTLPGDKLKQLKQRITVKIDSINTRLGLDLVVRDDAGNILNPDISSAVKLFRHHYEADNVIKMLKGEEGSIATVKRKPHICWTAYINITNIIIRVPESSEISVGLFCGDPSTGTERPLSENYTVRWTEDGYTGNQDLLFKTKCLFTDLSTVTLEEKQVWLLGSIVREGSMISKEENKRNTLGIKKPPVSDAVRRPYGMVILDVTEEVKKLKASALNYLGSSATIESECFAPLYLCGDKETLEPKKLLQLYGKETGRDKMGIRFTLQLINGDLTQLREENPHLLSLREVPVANRLGLSDVIMPGDVRNDLYITLFGGEFSRGAKTSDRNVEVTVTVIDERGNQVPGVISQGCSKENLDHYRSVTYHHDSKPKWMETLKIALPIDEFKKAHVKFTFKHRSTNDVKDKTEKPFAFSFVKLMQENGTTLMNVDHDLIVYKCGKKWTEEDFSYLNLPWRRLPGEELERGNKEFYTPNSRDNFIIATTFCSTKLTQNAELLSLLEWGWSGSTDKQLMRNCLDRLSQVPPEELMIFLQDTLDVLLEILMNNTEDDDGDNRIFEALVNVITIAMDKNKQEAFQPVLDSYIQQNFHATLVYNKLIHVLKYFVEHCMDPKCQKTLKFSMKCLQYIFKFIIRSRQLFVDLYGRGREEFEKSLHQLLEAMAKMMVHTHSDVLTIQAHCLKYITATISDTITNFDPLAMSHILVIMLENLDPKRIPKAKLTTLNEIIHSELFKIRECRQVLLPSFVDHIKKLVAANEEITDAGYVTRKKEKEAKIIQKMGDSAVHVLQTERNKDKDRMIELELCVKILGDILDVLFSADVGPTYDDINLLTTEMLQNILSIVVKADRTENMDILRKFVSVLVSLMRQMSERHFSAFLNQYTEQEDLMAFLVELLMAIQDLIECPVFPSDWAEMVLLQNSVMVKVLRHCSYVISEKMREPFKETIWSNFFHCAIKFVTQPSLQLERFTQSKRNKILNRYKDMRKETALEIKKLWFSLGQYKIRFIATTGGPSMVGPFLEMTMLPDYDLRKATIPIFFDMMQCEFYSCKERSSQYPPEMGGPRDGKIKGKFDEFEREILEKLDHLVEGGRGDEHYREVFHKIVGALCEDHTTMRDPGLRLVSTVTKLMDRLLQYRAIMNTPDYSPETRMSCTVNLLDFYSSINRKELYLRYVYKLVDLHLNCDNYTEAGYTLLQHANLLKWEDESVPQTLRSPLFPNHTRHKQLKEELYQKIIGYFDKGKMWEDALTHCKELMRIYEDVILDYTELAKLHSKIAEFYKKIMDPHNMRPEPEYFRVAYYGRGFPAFLQNKVFVYRGNGYERLSDFTSRILDQFPNAERMTKLTPPSKEVKESPQQFLQIVKVDCVMADNLKFNSPSVSESIQSYYRVNHIKTFSFSRPFHRGQKDSANEFATLCLEKTTLKTSYELPGILRCFPVSDSIIEELSPLENANQSMKTVCNELTETIKKYYKNQTLPLDPLTRKLAGMVDPAVMGGVANYEKAFVNGDYLQQHPADEEKVGMLQGYIAMQVPLLEIGLSIHSTRITESSLQYPLHKHMIESFHNMKSDVEAKHGVGHVPDLGFEIGRLRIQRENSYQRDASPRNSHLIDNMSGSQMSLQRLSTTFSPNKVQTLPRNHKSSTAGLNQPNGNVVKIKKDSKSFRKIATNEFRKRYLRNIGSMSDNLEKGGRNDNLTHDDKLMESSIRSQGLD